MVVLTKNSSPQIFILGQETNPDCVFSNERYRLDPLTNLTIHVDEFKELNIDLSTDVCGNVTLTVRIVENTMVENRKKQQNK